MTREQKIKLMNLTDDTDPYDFVGMIDKFAAKHGVTFEEALAGLRQGWADGQKESPAKQRRGNRQAAVKAGFIKPESHDDWEQ